MATWKRFTDHSGSEVDVNIDQVAYIQRHGDLTNLCFAGGVGNGAMIVISVKRRTISCIVVVFDSKFQTYIRYYLSWFRMDSAHISKTYSGRQIFYVLEVEGDDIVVEHLNPDKTTVARGFRSAQIPLPGNIDQSEKASLPTTVGLTNPSPHSSVWRQKMLPSGVADFRRIDRKWRIASGEAVVTRRADHSPGDHP